MGDIVGRLRAWNGSPFDDEAQEAADEIERLRAAVEAFLAYDRCDASSVDMILLYDTARTLARAALKGEK